MKTVVVFGVARGGTSMTAGILSCLGVDMNLVHNPHEAYPKGSFEDQKFMDLTHQATEDLWKGFSEEQLRVKYSKPFEDWVHSRQGDLWGTKSGVAHWVSQLFMPFLSDPHLVFVFRNCFHIAQSWSVHISGRVKFGKALEVAGDSTKQLIKCINKYPKAKKIFTTYEDIKLDPLFEATRFSRFLEVDFSGEAATAVSQLILKRYTTRKKGFELSDRQIM